MGSTIMTLAKLLLVPVLLLPGGFVVLGALWLWRRRHARPEPSA